MEWILDTETGLRLHAGRLFTGEGPLIEDRVVTIARGRVVKVAAGGARDADLSVPLIAPGFVDLQINGGGGYLFNTYPCPDTLIAMRDAARRSGTTQILPTFITAPERGYLRAIAAVETCLARAAPGILGIHLEGPFLNPGKAGIHDTAAIRRLEAGDLDCLGRPGPGVRLVTLAPERQAPGTVRALCAAGWRVFAGHSLARPEDIAGAVAEGLAGVTHLFNAMSQIEARAPGLVGAAFAHRLWAGIIADGIHVHPANLALAHAVLGERLFLVTDAMSTLGSDIGSFDLGARRITLEDGRLTDAEGRLAGAHLAMDAAVRTMVGSRAASLAQALAMASRNPARCIGRPDLGWIGEGAPADLALLDEALHAIGTVVGGDLVLERAA